MKIRKKLDLFSVLTIAGLTLIGGLLLAKSLRTKSTLADRTVMITNYTKNHGGSGSVIESTPEYSLILTNKHVCSVVHNGGLVVHRGNEYFADAFAESTIHDLCLIRVSTDLGVNTPISQTGPSTYEPITIAGHPNLLPLVMTQGHTSDLKVVEIMTGVRKCDEEDMKNPDKAAFCAFFGRLPVTQKYQSRLFTATIMPGSSGSAIYNNKNEVVGVVFAGSGTLGYALAVPIEYVNQFLHQDTIQFVKTNAINEMRNPIEEEESFKKQAIAKCFIEPEILRSKECRIINNGFSVEQ